MPEQKVLEVYLLGERVGQLHQNEAGRLSFVYLKEWLDNKDARPLSISLPLQAESFDDRYARPYFASLLPDDRLRVRLAQVIGVSEKNDYSMLEVVGGECAGAVALYSGDTQPEDRLSGGTEQLDSEHLAKILNILENKPLLAGAEGIRLSLAGAQNKLAICLDDKGDVALAKGARPTTHIIKPAIDKIPNSVENEFFCMQLAQSMGLNTPDTEYRNVKDIPFLLIERYDRLIDDKGNVTRLHQEDFCQALSIPPENKYEREGGPSLEMCFQLLERCAQPAKDRLNLISAVIFNFLIGNADAHGKNFSLIHQNKDNIRLSPFYDLYCTRVYPELDSKMAMKIGRKYKFDEVYARHWGELAKSIGFKEDFLMDQLRIIARKLPVESVKVSNRIKKQHGLDCPIFDKILSHINENCETLLRILEGSTEVATE